MKIITKVLLILLVCYTVAAANDASFEVFLKIDGIEGDSTASHHEHEINVLTFNMGVLNSGTSVGGGGGDGKAQFTGLTVFKFIDKASPALFLASALGTHIQNATLVVRTQLGRGDTFGFYRIDLDDVVVSSVSNNGTTDQNGNLLEQITLNCGKITWEFREQDPRGGPGGTIKKSFDFRTGKGG